MESVKNDSPYAGRELFITRLLAAPQELVWQVFTDPAHISNWWGPDGFSTTIQTMDVVPGGEWKLVMHGPDGRDYKNLSIYTTVIPFEKLVYEHVSVPKFTATIEFLQEGNQTRLNWHMLFDSVESLEQVVKVFKADIGLEQNGDKLRAYLVKQPIVLERLLNAPPEQVWRAITEKAAMKEWYFDLETFRAEKGFRFEFTGGHEEGVQYVHICEVTEVIPGRKLTYSWSYKGYPGMSWVSFELVPQGDQTKLVLTHTGVDSFPAEVQDFAKHNFLDGWNYILHISLKAYIDGLS